MQFSPHIEQAIRFASEVHKNQIRYISKNPYIVHPMMVALQLAEYLDDSDVIIAAILHDTVEDGDDAQDIQKNIADYFGEKVLAYVMECTEKKNKDKSIPYKERKKVFINRMRDYSKGALYITYFDRLDNLKGLIDDHRLIGVDVWSSFALGKEGRVWFYTETLNMLKELSFEKVLTDQFEETLGKVKELSE